MGVIDVEALSKEVSAEAPAGADIEFDPAYFELEKLAQGTPESVMGNEVKPAEEPDFREVKKAALALAGKSRDLRVAVMLTAALLKEDGLPGFRDGVALTKAFVEKMWDQFFPKLDPEDNNDPTIRVNILKGFDGDGSAADLYKFKIRLRDATLTNSEKRIGKFSFRDIQLAKGEIPLPSAAKGQPEPKVPDINLINAAFDDTKTEDLQATEKLLTETVELVKGLDAALGKRLGPGVGPDFTALKGVLGNLKETITSQLAKRGAAPEPGTEGATPAAPGEKKEGAARSISGEINSREDVLRVLDKISDYYARHEPGSPIPIFMKRAKRLVKMNFVEVIKDLIPDAMSKIDVYTGELAEKAPKK